MIDRRSLLAASLALPLALAAGSASAQTAPQKLPVLTSFTILADLIGRVGGDRVAVTSLVGPGGDAHVFQPSPADARKVADSRLIVMNGLHFEGWLVRLVEAAGSKAPMIRTTDGVTPRKMPEERDEQGRATTDKHGHQHDVDPHAWQSAANAKIYVENICKALSEVDPAGAPVYAANAAAYLTELDALDAEIRSAVARLPESRRSVVTTHDAFGYFADAYGLKFIAPKGVSSEAEASAKDVARIIRQIKAEKIPAVFLENVTDPRLIRRIAAETGAKIGGELFSDSLSAPDGPAPTYLDMMRHNMRELTKALSS